jgi:hypothetical protein
LSIEDFPRWALRNQPPGVEYASAIGERARLIEVVGAEDQGSLGLDTAQDFSHLVPLSGVEPVAGFVQDDQRGLDEEGLSERDAPLEALGEISGPSGRHGR